MAELLGDKGRTHDGGPVSACLEYINHRGFSSNGCIDDHTLNQVRRCHGNQLSDLLLSNSDFVQKHGGKMPSYALDFEKCQNGKSCKPSDFYQFAKNNFAVVNKELSAAENNLNTDNSELAKTKIAIHDLQTDFKNKYYKDKTQPDPGLLGMHITGRGYELDDTPPAYDLDGDTLKDYAHKLAPLLEKQDGLNREIENLNTNTDVLKSGKSPDSEFYKETLILEKQTAEAVALAEALVGCCGNNACKVKMSDAGVKVAPKNTSDQPAAR